MHPWISMDPFIVLSLVNAKLRNFHSSLENLCEDLDIKQELLVKKLFDIGYSYNEHHNAFISVETECDSC